MLSRNLAVAHVTKAVYNSFSDFFIGMKGITRQEIAHEVNNNLPMKRTVSQEEERVTYETVRNIIGNRSSRFI